MTHESPLLMSIAAYYKNDKLDGIGVILPRKHFGEKLGMLATSIVDAMLEYDRAARCLVPAFDGAICSKEWKEALRARFSTAAPP